MLRAIDPMIENGSVQFFKKIDPTPRTIESRDGVTVINEPTEGRPACFEVRFSVSLDVEAGPIRTACFLNFALPILDENENAPYREVENKAFQQIAPILRSAADKIERLAAEFDARQSATADEA